MVEEVCALVRVMGVLSLLLNLKGVVEVRREVEVEGERVKVGDVAVVVARDARTAKSIANIFLRPSPPPGAEAFVPRTVVTGRVRERVGSWVLVVGAVAAKVKRAFTLVSREEVRRKIEEALASVLRGREGRVVVEVPSLAKDFLLPKGEVKVEVGVKSLSSTGWATVIVSFKVKGKGVVKRLPLRAKVLLIRRVVVARRPIPMGSKVKEGDVELAEANIMGKEGVLDDLKKVVGRVARRPIRAGEVVTSSLLRPPEVVRRGDRVRVILRSGGVVVQLLGKALDGGGVGEKVRVRIEGRRGEFLGRVAAKGEVMVEL
ncbi:MAG TPA: flagellar basal body P-ring formation protein FlgA [Armatimonadetes bacterium]|nr:flagellar basal body P-ring formation protein FlgA [Armatimonadota bacterium]